VISASAAYGRGRPIKLWKTIEATHLVTLPNNGVRLPRLRNKEVEVNEWQIHEDESFVVTGCTTRANLTQLSF
jgi:hypothetical protein